MRRALLLSAAVLAVVSNPAAGAVWSYRCPGLSDCPTSNGAGNLIDSELRFNTSHLDFTWKAVFSPNEQNCLPSGLWAVVSKGPEPELTSDQFAILYGDVATGRVSAYVYDKNVGEDSWQNGTFIESIPGALTSQMVGPNLEWTLLVNVANINSFAGPNDWVGVFFEDEIGFWTAALKDLQVDFAADGQINSFTFTDRTSWDRHDRTTAPPVPVENVSWGRVKSNYRD